MLNLLVHLNSPFHPITGHDFFNTQPIINASVFLLRHILHDWSDPYCIKILTQLRQAAQPDTHLIIIDAVLQYSCPSDRKWKDVPGGEAPVAPEPLLPNFGIGKADEIFVDMMVRCLVSSIVKRECDFLLSIATAHASDKHSRAHFGRAQRAI